MLFNIEITDTFGGEANYAWVIREQFMANDDISDDELAQKTLDIIGWKDEPVSIETIGDMIRIMPHDSNLVCFVTCESM